MWRYQQPKLFLTIVVNRARFALFFVPNLHDRVKLWEEISGHMVSVRIGDLRQWDFISNLFKTTQPDAIIYYAEQPSAPYSMLNRNAAFLTIRHNIEITANVIFAVKEHAPNTHIIKLQIKSLPNPRKKTEDHYYNPTHTRLLDLGLKPHYLNEDVLS